MSVVISGALIDGAGIPISRCHIILKSRVNTSEVVMRTVADVVTGNNGEYSFEAQTGKYCVYLKQDWRDEYCVGDISVYYNSKPGTLNDFLTVLDEDDLKPDVVKRFEALVEQAQQSAEAAAESEQQAGKHAGAAALAKEEVKKLAAGVQQNAEAVAEDKRQVEMLASQIEDTASEVRQDAEAAKKAVSDAEQARDEIDTALSATLKTANHLSEITAEGEEAQQKSRDNLGLKSAATMEVQSDIYDRTEGRLALPGAFGFGYPFGKNDRITFENTSELTTWVKNAYPGRYAVAAPNQVTIIPGISFTGILDVIWQMNRFETKPPSDAIKCIMFYAGNGDIWFNRYLYGRLVGWERIKISTADIYNVMGGAISNEWGDPDVGGLIIAAYQGITDGDTKIKLVRGQYYAGSRLGPVGISAPYNPAGTYSSTPQYYVMGNAGHSLPGTYRALSGITNTYGSDAMIGLFIRTA